jgi:UPF0716 protein FxsA
MSGANASANRMNPSILLILLPIPEIWLIVKVGAVVGAGWTVVLLLASAALGVVVLQRQGLAALSSLPRAMNDGASLAQTMIEKLLAVAAGLLLILPGFITDAVALVLLVPPLRRLVARRWLGRATVVGSVSQSRQDAGVIDGESHRVDD